MDTPARLSYNVQGLQFAWDATSLSAFAKCPRYYQLSVIQGWRAVDESPHLKFGGAYAKALETFFKLLATGHDREAATISVVREAMIATWNYPTDPAEGEGSPWESLHTTKTRETLIRSIVWYLDHFADDQMPVHHFSDGRPAVELSFSLPFGNVMGVELLYCGHMDRVVEYSNDLYVMDQKTSGSTISPKFFSDFTPDFQMSGYAWAGAQIFSTPVSGVIIDAAQIAVGFTRFERGFVHRSEQQLMEFHTFSLEVIEEAFRAHEARHYRMNPTACGNYGGCQFRKVCSRHPDHRASVLATHFTQRGSWDPLKQR